MSANPTAMPNLVDIYVHGRLLGEWVKYNHFYLYPFLGLTYKSELSAEFRARLLKRRALVHGCAFWGFVDMDPHLGGQLPKTPNRRIQAKLEKSKNKHNIKITAPIPTEFCTAIKTTKFPLWVVRTWASQIQAGGRRHLAKIAKLL